MSWSGNTKTFNIDIRSVDQNLILEILKVLESSMEIFGKSKKKKPSIELIDWKNSEFEFYSLKFNYDYGFDHEFNKVIPEKFRKRFVVTNQLIPGYNIFIHATIVIDEYDSYNQSRFSETYYFISNALQDSDHESQG